jgi:hypothetical protein
LDDRPSGSEQGLLVSHLDVAPHEEVGEVPIKPKLTESELPDPTSGPDLDAGSPQDSPPPAGINSSSVEGMTGRKAGTRLGRPSATTARSRSRVNRPPCFTREAGRPLKSSRIDAGHRSTGSPYRAPVTAGSDGGFLLPSSSSVSRGMTREHTTCGPRDLPVISRLRLLCVQLGVRQSRSKRNLVRAAQWWSARAGMERFSSGPMRR